VAVRFSIGRKRFMGNNNTQQLLSEICINTTGDLCEIVDFGNEVVEYKINGVTEHVIYGIFFSFNQKSEIK
jgi:hypothetical protein